MSDPCFGTKESMHALEQAMAFLLERARPPVDVEEVDAMDALGRVLAGPVVSALNVPPWDNSAMDGYAVSTSDMPASGEVVVPVSQRVPAGSAAEPLQPGTAARIPPPGMPSASARA